MGQRVSKKSEKSGSSGERVNGIHVSKYTIQRILRSFGFSWRRIRKKPKGEPEPEEYTQKKEALEQFQQQAEKERLILL